MGSTVDHMNAEQRSNGRRRMNRPGLFSCWVGSAYFMHNTTKSSTILEATACAIVVATVVVANRGSLMTRRTIRISVARHGEGRKRAHRCQRGDVRERR